jgi:hypothetical protein
MRIVRELLDKQIIDRAGERIGRVDGILLELVPGEPPRVHKLELGWVTIADRVHPRLARLVERAHRRWSVRRSARSHIDWDAVIAHNVHHIQVDVAAAETAAFDWELWLRRHVIGKIPGGRQKE